MHKFIPFQDVCQCGKILHRLNGSSIQHPPLNPSVSFCRDVREALGGLLIGFSWCRDTSVSRMDVRLVVVEFPTWEFFMPYDVHRESHQNKICVSRSGDPLIASWIDTLSNVILTRIVRYPCQNIFLNVSFCEDFENLIKRVVLGAKNFSVLVTDIFLRRHTGIATSAKGWVGGRSTPRNGKLTSSYELASSQTFLTHEDYRKKT